MTAQAEALPIQLFPRRAPDRVGAAPHIIYLPGPDAPDEEEGGASLGVAELSSTDLIIDLIPALRAFARSLTRNATEADDLLQETLVKALANIGQFTPGTNLKAWLFRIERNAFYTQHRKRRREGPLPAEEVAEPSTLPEQEWWLKVRAVDHALQALPDDQKEALLLVSDGGLSYEEAAELCGCALGTIKSRVSRARSRLLTLLQVDSQEEFLEVDRQGF